MDLLARTRFFVLGAVLALLISMAPFRLMGLTAEMFMLRPGNTHNAATTAHYWDVQDLSTRLNRLGWRIIYATPITMDGDRVYGITVFDEHVIAIDSGLAWDARYAVLAHEGGHTHQPFWVDKAQGDCYAEAVATLVAQDGIREHARYLADNRWTCLGVFLAEWPSIYNTAATLRD